MFVACYVLSEAWASIDVRWISEGLLRRLVTIRDICIFSVPCYEQRITMQLVAGLISVAEWNRRFCARRWPWVCCCL